MTKKDMYLAERKKGLTYREIAEKYGVSQQSVGEICRQSLNNFKAYTPEEVVYSGLRRWLNENKVTRKEFAWMLGHRSTNPVNHISIWFRGVRDPQKRTIDKMLKITGLTYEEMFKEDAK